MTKKTKTITLMIAFFMLFISKPVMAQGQDCQGVFMTAVTSIAAFPLSAVQGLVRLVGAGKSACSCNTATQQQPCSYSMVTAPTPAAYSRPTMPAYVTYQIMPAVQQQSAPVYPPNTYLYAPLPFRQ